MTIFSHAVSRKHHSKLFLKKLLELVHHYNQERGTQETEDRSRSSEVSVLKELSYTNEKIYARLLMAACKSGKLETKRRLDSEL